ncbi:MAG: DMT family transporter [Anaerolineae bacterium]
MKLIHWGALILLGAIWGASFLFIREAAHDFGPVMLMFLRVLFAGFVLMPFAPLLLRHQSSKSVRLRDHWRPFLIMGTLNAALPFTLIAFSELTLTASMASIFNSLTPLCTALVAAVWIGERLTGKKIIGAIMGIIGVAILVGGSPLDLTWEFIIAVLASILAALCYGLGTVYASRNTRGLPVIQASIGQLLGAAAILTIPATVTVPDAVPATSAILALTALILLSTSFAYLLYFYLLSNVGPTRTASVTFLVPIFGTIWGILFLNEPFNLSMLLGMVVILLSVGLVIGVNIGRRKPLAV